MKEKKWQNRDCSSQLKKTPLTDQIANFTLKRAHLFLRYHVVQAWRKRNLKFSTAAVNLNKRLEQIKLIISLYMCASVSELPSNIRTMIKTKIETLLSFMTLLNIFEKFE